MSEQKLMLYYFAYWPDVTYRMNNAGEYEIVDGEVYVTAWAELPLLHLTAARYDVEVVRAC